MAMTWSQAWLPFALAALGAALLTPLVIRLAWRLGALAQPRADRWHQRPTALLGGTALYAASVTTALLMLATAFPPGRAAQTRLLGLWAGATLVFALGLIDDRRGLGPTAKLAGEAAAACLLMSAGTRFTGALPVWLAAPLTLFWVVGITNAVNLLDNMDGVVAGVAAVAALALAATPASGYPAAARQGEVVVLALCLAGACCGFLGYNFHPARIFMGDCGSLFLGFMLSALALAGTMAPSTPMTAVIIVPVAILAIPIFDTTLVTVARRRHGRPVSLGGRDHTTHRLAALGMSERTVALSLYAGAAVLSALGLVAARLSLLAGAALAGLVLAALGLFGAFLYRVRVYAPEADRISCGARPAQGGTAADEPSGGLRRANGDHRRPQADAPAA
jgi:UDP-N-acetylmuramyl pentapeptide phosphotransferase/UDP-N-acetylglucosamine-1-phosphate transferase